MTETVTSTDGLVIPGFQTSCFLEHLWGDCLCVKEVLDALQKFCPSRVRQAVCIQQGSGPRAHLPAQRVLQKTYTFLRANGGTKLLSQLLLEMVVVVIGDGMAGRAEQEHVMGVVVLHLDGEVSSVFMRNNVLPREDKPAISLHFPGVAIPQFLVFPACKGSTNTKSPGKKKITRARTLSAAIGSATFYLYFSLHVFCISLFHLLPKIHRFQLKKVIYTVTKKKKRAMYYEKHTSQLNSSSCKDKNLTLCDLMGFRLT